MIEFAGYPCEVLVANLEIVLAGDLHGIPDPFADDMNRGLGRQLGLAGGPHIVEQLVPGRQAGRFEQVDEFYKDLPAAAREAIEKRDR